MSSKTMKFGRAENASFKASERDVRAYFDTAKKFIDGTQRELPDPGAIATERLALDSSLLKVKTGSDSVGPFVSAFIEFKESEGMKAPENPYLFDPWWFAIWRWLELAPKARGGKHFRLNRVNPDGKLRYYPASTSVKNFSLRRLIMNTPEGKATPQKGWDYHDHRKIALRTEADRPFKARTKFKGRTPFREREMFLKRLSENIRRALRGKRKFPGLDLTRADYLRSLTEWFDVADKLSKRCYPQSQ